jgi:putative transport protein
MEMEFDLTEWLTSPFVLMAVSVFTGVLMGRLKIGRFSFGVSGALFTGLLFGWLVYGRYALPFKGAPDAPRYAANMLQNGVIHIDFFYLFLILFVAAVGLLASKDLGAVVRKYGVKFIILGLLITFAGAAVTYLMVLASPGQNPFAVSGVFMGALTSSPGLGAAIETVSRYGTEAEAAVGAGYAISYPFGVLVVILAVNFIPLILGIDMEREKEVFNREMAEARSAAGTREVPEVSFDIAGFFLTILIGYTIGSIKVPMGPLGYFSLGSTGGVLIGALLLGYIGRLGGIHFRMGSKVLGVIREVSLAFFLSTVGLRYGYRVFDALISGGAYLAFVSLVVGAAAILAGYLVGRHLFGINWVMLSGAICGGMTSTPGLGAAIDAVGSDDPAAGYGAVYPFALLGMVMFSILLHRVPIS